MLSEARWNANRRNALKSTGPKTEAGKERSRQNALKHGLTGTGLALPEEEAAEVDRRSRDWEAELRPRSAVEQWIVKQVVLASVRLERCADLEWAQRGQAIHRAECCWNEDRRLDAELLAGKLAKDPRLVVRQLRQTKQGCDWLIDQWNALKSVVEHHGSLSEADRHLAADLLGLAAGLRDGDATLPWNDREAFKARIDQELQDLAALKTEALDDLDEEDRTIAVSGLNFDARQPARLLRRYEANSRRVLFWGLRELEKRAKARAQRDDQDEDDDSEFTFDPDFELDVDPDEPAFWEPIPPAEPPAPEPKPSPAAPSPQPPAPPAPNPPQLPAAELPISLTDLLGPALRAANRRPGSSRHRHNGRAQ